MNHYLLPDYEKNCLSIYLNEGEEKLIFANQSDNELKKMITSIKENSNNKCYIDLELLLKDEMREISVFIQFFYIKSYLK